MAFPYDEEETKRALANYNGVAMPDISAASRGATTSAAAPAAASPVAPVEQTSTPAPSSTPAPAPSPVEEMAKPTIDPSTDEQNKALAEVGSNYRVGEEKDEGKTLGLEGQSTVDGLSDAVDMAADLEQNPSGGSGGGLFKAIGGLVKTVGNAYIGNYGGAAKGLKQTGSSLKQ